MGGNAPLDAHIGRAVDIFGLIPAQIEAALDNYADFTDEIDEIHDELAVHFEATENAEAF